MMEFKKTYTFDDVLLVPADFSEVRSRAEVDTCTYMVNKTYGLGIVSSNMDSVYSPVLAREVAKNGGISCVHRFCSIEENINLFVNGVYQDVKPWVSIGVSNYEFERARELVGCGAETILIDVANGASIQVAEQFNRLKQDPNFNYVQIVVGNFATSSQIRSFIHHVGRAPDLFKVGIGPGSACSTRVVTGVGIPSVTTIMDCVSTGYPIIQDGGIRNSGDFCKALALGCKAVIVGKLFAACEESGAKDVVVNIGGYEHSTGQKIYRGSASLSSYKTQGKESIFRAPEGEEITIPISGKVIDLMNKFNGGLRSSMSYLNATNLEQFRENAEFILTTTNGTIESRPHALIK